MRNATYDLFRGTSRENAVWIGTVEGLEAAADRMSCLALSAPDDYFLSHCGKIVASVQKRLSARRSETSPSWKIAIVSSDSEHLTTLAEILKRQGMEFLCMPTVSQYRDVLSKQRVDLVFSDPELSDGNYLDVINAARSLGSGARIVLTSRQASWPEFLDAMRVGAFDVISKPCRPKDVEWMVIQAKRDNRKKTKELKTSNERIRARGAA